MNHRKSLIAKLAALPAAVLLALSAGPVFAVHETGFSELDVNEDGVISREEARGRLADDYAEIDDDGDGLPTIDEEDGEVRYRLR